MNKSLLLNQQLGRIGENIAASYLKKKGLRIIERNFKKQYGELDIIALDKNILVAVEVKTRIGDEFGWPEESVTPRKLREVIYTFEFYKTLHPELPAGMRIDVIAVDLDHDARLVELRHIPNVTQ